MTVNHPLNFVDPDIGSHTSKHKRIYGGKLKGNCLKHTQDIIQLYLHLAEYLWRNMTRRNTDILQEFLKDAAKYYMGPQCNNLFEMVEKYFISNFGICNSKYL